jgi:ketosteroid isomerase-like protein
MTDHELIIEAEKAIADAHVTMDIRTIDDLLHDDYVIVQPGGKIESKADVLSSYKTGRRYWNRAEVDELEVRIYEKMARVVGRWTARGANNGVAFDYQARFISIWIKQGVWKTISYSSSEIGGHEKSS